MNKKANKFEYPHPLIRNLNETKKITQQNVKDLLKQKLPLYETNYTFSSSIKTMVSPKLLRVSNKKVIAEEKFGILMQPFNSSQEVQTISRTEIEKTNSQCKNCHAFFNHQSQSISLYEIKCKFCDHTQSVNIQLKNTFENVPNCWDLIFHENSSDQKVIEKNICFVLQASQFNYNYRIHEIIKNCLTSLQSTVSANLLERKLSEVATQDGSTEQIQHNSFQILQNQPKVHYNISFILFNDKNLMILNQLTKDIVNFNHQFLQNQGQSSRQSIMPFDELFRPLESMNQETYDIIEEILYQSFMKNTSCLDFATEFIQKMIDNYSSKSNKQNSLNQICKRQIQYKFFVNSLRSTKPTTPFKTNSSELTEQSKGLFSNVSNTISSKLSSAKMNQSARPNSVKPQQQQNQTIKSAFRLCSNFEFFYFPQHHVSSLCQTPQKQVIRKLNNNLYRMYPNAQDQSYANKQDLFNQVYYDLFQNLSNPHKYFDVKMKIVTSQKVQILDVGNQTLGYHDSRQNLRKTFSAAKTGKKFNLDEIELKSLSSNSILPIDLKILTDTKLKTNKKSPCESAHFVQISFEYKQQYHGSEPNVEVFERVFQVNVASLNRPINFQSHIYASLSSYVDDQVLFYFHLRSIFAECHKTKTNHTILKKLQQKMGQISDRFKDVYGQINFHKQYVRIFLYAFMVKNMALVNGINQDFYYSRHLWMKNSMQCFSKSIYPRTYEIIRKKQTHQVELKNVKSSPKYFKSNSLNLVDNGANLYFVIGEDNSVQDLKTIFGTCFIDQIRQMSELPELQSNSKYRQAIDLARSLQQSNFLPLKIIQLFSPQFDSQISHLLYIKDNHYNFMRQLWEMEPIGKQKMRR